MLNKMQDLARHLKEAIQLNTERMPFYAKLSNNQTVPFSKELIRYEKLALLGAWIFDRTGDKLQQHGIPYLKAEFVEMSSVPSFAKKYPSSINYTNSLKKIDIHCWQQTFNLALKNKDLEKIVSTALEFLDVLSAQPHVYCMLRHIVESLGRIAYLLPWHEKLCKQQNIKSPKSYSFILLKLHVRSFIKTTQFDEAVAPIQQSGLPFIYQDLPHIDVKPNFEALK